MPSEIAGKENGFLNFIDQIFPETAKKLTPYEIGTILFKVFVNFFHLVLNISRLVDLTPTAMMEESIKKINRNHVKTLQATILSRKREIPQIVAEPVFEAEASKAVETDGGAAKEEETK